MRLKFETLLEVQDYYGSSDFQVEAKYEQLVNERGDSYYGEYIMFRFGYWNELYYEYEFYDIKITNDRNKSDSVLNIMKNINTIYSNWILSEPDEWLWTHKRWIQKK